MADGNGTTLVLVHGLWMTPHSWDGWVQRYSARGFQVIAPGWPGIDDRSVDDINRDPTPLNGVGVGEIADSYERVIRELPQKPIIVGHSFGGLVTQILVDRGIASAAVAIASAPPKGLLFTPPSSLKVAFPSVSNPANLKKTKALDAKQFHYAFCNTMSIDESEKVRQGYAVPGPCRTLFQAALANFTPHAATTINFKNDDRAPMLIVGGQKDHITPTAATHANYKKYQHTKCVTEMKVYPGRCHWTIVNEAGWEDIADESIDWAVKHAAMYSL